MSENEKKGNPQPIKNEEENLETVAQKGGTNGGKMPNTAGKSGTTGG